ncbi:helix-turn-helix domain-containing protein [Leifsonia sp. Root1293]|nr:helix-turn-helix transcriptional regulator [Leifsonia sp. Root1293]
METARQRGNDIGPTGKTVAENVKRLRGELNLKQSELSERLSALGQPIPTASIGKLESGLRKVEVDDLMAIAVALNVSPLALLLPDTRSPEAKVDVTGAENQRSGDVWQFGLGETPLAATAPPGALDFQERTMPYWAGWQNQARDQMAAFGDDDGKRP